MSLKMHVDIVSAERTIFSGLAEKLFVRGELGELGILPRHTPLLTRINPGLVRLVIGPEQEEAFFISSGFLEVQPHIVTVLADTVVRTDELDEAAARAAREIKRAEQKGARLDAELQVQLALLRALEQVQRAKKR